MVSDNLHKVVDTVHENAVLSGQAGIARETSMEENDMQPSFGISILIGLVLISLPVGSDWCGRGQQAE
jgi:hypothetical protein